MFNKIICDLVSPPLLSFCLKKNLKKQIFSNRNIFLNILTNFFWPFESQNFAL